MRFIIHLKRILRLFVVWHGESFVGIILSEIHYTIFSAVFQVIILAILTVLRYTIP